MTSPSPRRADPPSPDAALPLIRIALLAGVLLFGAVTWFLHRQAPPSMPAGLPALRYAAILVWLLAVGGIIVVSRTVRATSERARRASLSLTGWALGEGAALFGAVYYFLTGNPSRYFVGLFILLSSYMLIPVRRA